MNIKHPAARTSVNQVPAAFKEPVIANILTDGVNLDYGGGRFDTATKYLDKTLNCTNLVYDPLNRSAKHNKEMLQNPCFTSMTCLNVLNVVLSKEERLSLLKTVHKMTFDIQIDRVVFQVYEGDKSGVPSDTQANLRPAEYLEEIQQVFGSTSWEVRTLGAKKNIFVLKYNT